MQRLRDWTARLRALARHGAGVAVLVTRVLIGRGDSRPGQNVVELVEQYELPGLRQFGRGVGGAIEPRRHGAPALGGEQQVLSAAVPALHPRVGRIAADGVVLKVADVRGEVKPARHGVEVAPRARELQAQAVVSGVQALDAVEVLTCGTAAVVAYPVEDHELLFVSWRPFQGALEGGVERIAGALIAVRDTVSEYSRAVGRGPPEHFCGQRFLLRRGAKEHVGVHPCLGEQLGKGGGMAERVEVAADRRQAAEAVA